ncbi:DUF2157 domain-containing protein [candidate division KSB1 bacterium]|nr:DUF2157 domain-containing protein [candidate division KSB1 bacterium]
MKNSKHIQWLYRELPALMNDGVITAEITEKLRAYYGEIKEGSKSRIALIIFGVLGALLVGSGIILLLAHNWDELSRATRTVLSFAPLLAGQALAGWTLIRKSESVAWREGTATFLMLAIGASISLIGQTYHISGDTGKFLLTWMLLGVPLVYLLNASVPALLYFWGITAWAGVRQYEAGHVLFFWPLAVLIIPHFWQAVKENRYGVRAVSLASGISLSLCVATGIVLEGALPGLWIVVYSGLFAALFLVGSSYFDEAPTLWQRPFQTFGAAGIAVLAFLLTYKWPWERIGWEHYRTGAAFYSVAAIFDYVLAAALVFVALYFLFSQMRHWQITTLLLGMMPFISIIGYVVTASLTSEVFALILFNLYLFALGLATTISGIRNGHLGTVNAGMLILAALIVARFFDSDLGFVIRGLAFILVGMGFLLTNWIIIRKINRNPNG